MSGENESRGAVEELREDLSDLAILKTSWEGRRIDDTLQTIVHFANECDAGASISLTIGGSLVTGVLISADSYFDQLIAGFTSASDDGKNLAPAAMAKILTARKPASGSPVPSQFLHLKDAKIYNGGDMPIPGNGTLWRGKISSVDGFFFGVVRPNSN